MDILKSTQYSCVVSSPYRWTTEYNYLSADKHMYPCSLVRFRASALSHASTSSSIAHWNAFPNLLTQAIPKCDADVARKAAWIVVCKAVQHSSFIFLTVDTERSSTVVEVSIVSYGLPFVHDRRHCPTDFELRISVGDAAPILTQCVGQSVRSTVIARGSCREGYPVNVGRCIAECGDGEGCQANVASRHNCRAQA